MTQFSYKGNAMLQNTAVLQDTTKLQELAMLQNTTATTTTIIIIIIIIKTTGSSGVTVTNYFTGLHYVCYKVIQLAGALSPVKAKGYIRAKYATRHNYVPEQSIC